MASNFTNFPAFEECYQLFVEAVKAIAKIQRDYRYSLGEEVKHKLMDLMMLVYKANREKEKLNYIYAAKEKLFEAQLLLRVLNEVKQLSDGQFVLLMEKTVNADKQLTAWGKYNERKKKENDEKERG